MTAAKVVFAVARNVSSRSTASLMAPVPPRRRSRASQFCRDRLCLLIEAGECVCRRTAHLDVQVAEELDQIRRGSENRGMGVSDPAAPCLLLLLRVQLLSNGTTVLSCIAPLTFSPARWPGGEMMARGDVLIAVDPRRGRGRKKRWSLTP